MSDLTDFLLACITEDEAAAAHAAAESHGPAWEWDGNPVGSVGPPPMRMAADLYSDVGAHIARWDPARVLAECDAKRQIVDYARACDTAADEQPDEPFPGGSSYATTVMLRLLAVPYSGHEDFRPEWKP
jgi:hypothetical protein